MRPAHTLLLTLSLLCAATRPAPAAAQDENESTQESAEAAANVITEEPDTPGHEALAYNAEILDELMTRSTEQTIREQKFAGAAGITGGMILLGVGAWRLFEDTPQNQYSRGLGVMFMTLGMANLTTGIYAVTRIPHEKRRLDRWEKARKDGITKVELAHFEGELQAARDLREGERLLIRWDGLTHAIAGVLVIAFTPIPDGPSRTDRASGYIAGGLFIFVGLGAFGASFRDTPSEKAWSEYNKRKMPMPGHEFSWRLSPSVSREGAGLSFGGTF